MKMKKILFKVISVLLFLYMLTFISCEEGPCWLCSCPDGSAPLTCTDSGKSNYENEGCDCK
jgi:hypothetical protein